MGTGHRHARSVRIGPVCVKLVIDAYRVRAKFEQSSGSGQRVGKHKCEFRFKRR